MIFFFYKKINYVNAQKNPVYNQKGHRPSHGIWETYDSTQIFTSSCNIQKVLIIFNISTVFVFRIMSASTKIIYIYVFSFADFLSIIVTFQKLNKNSSLLSLIRIEYKFVRIEATINYLFYASLHSCWRDYLMWQLYRQGRAVYVCRYSSDAAVQWPAGL